ncbi:MAG TPA: transcriptional regulator NrdR [Tepidiformaceae bacterium]
MRCPYCHFRDSKVTDSRSTDDGIRRRRQCIACGERFTTLETTQLSAVQIVKKDGRREDFNREKLLQGLRRACEKRKISVQQLEAVVADIEGRISADGRQEVSSEDIGELAMDALRALDHIAYIRFASVYRSFADLSSLKEALLALEEEREDASRERSLQLPLPTEVQEPEVVAPRLLQEIESRHVAGALR